VEAKKKKGSVFVGNGFAVAHKNTSLLGTKSPFLCDHDQVRNYLLALSGNFPGFVLKFQSNSTAFNHSWQCHRAAYAIL